MLPRPSATPGTNTAYARLVCNTKLPTSTRAGRHARSPHASDHASTRNSRNGSSTVLACQGSTSTALPSDQHSAAVTAMAARAVTGPPRRQATAKMPSTEAQFTSAVPMTTPTGPATNAVGTASTQYSSGPGWLMSNPRPHDVDTHIPSDGASPPGPPPSTSRARTVSRAASPTGTQPSRPARTAATTTGSRAISSESQASRRVAVAARRSLAA